PGGTNAGGPYLDFSPAQGARTFQPGDEVTPITSRTIPPDDPVGQWRSSSTYPDAVGASPDADASVAFTVTAPQSRVAPAPSRPAAARPSTGEVAREARAPNPPALPPA